MDIPHSEKDRVFSRRRSGGRFSFDEAVARVFPDMVSRSVPGYDRMLEGIGRFAAEFVQPDTAIYDLGCSWGAGAIAAAQNIEHAPVEIVGIDHSAPMIEYAQLALERLDLTSQVQLKQADFRTTPLKPTSYAILNLTLQFIDPEEHDEIIQTIADATVSGGALVLSEKIRFEDVQSDQIVRDLHHEFKKSQGYSTLEISQKREALEGVLHRQTLAQHHERLRKAGYNPVVTWFRELCFASILAIKL